MDGAPGSWRAERNDGGKVKHSLEFDEARHVYTLDGRRATSVTEALSIVPHWEASDWYLDRGTQVHSAAAYIARGIDIDFDPLIAGQVQACRAWIHDFQPKVMHVETRVASALYGYAGTLDLAIEVGGKPYLVDYKGTLSKSVQWQLGGYSVAAKEWLGISFKHGFGVELKQDGTYRTGETYDLVRAGREFLAFLGAYNSMKREGVL